MRIELTKEELLACIDGTEMLIISCESYIEEYPEEVEAVKATERGLVFLKTLNAKLRNYSSAELRKDEKPSK